MSKKIQLVIFFTVCFVLFGVYFGLKDTKGNRDTVTQPIEKLRLDTHDLRTAPKFRTGPPNPILSGADNFDDIPGIDKVESKQIMEAIGLVDGITLNVTKVEHAWPGYSCALRVRVTEGFLILVRDNDVWTVKAFVKVQAMNLRGCSWSFTCWQDRSWYCDCYRPSWPSSGNS